MSSCLECGYYNKEKHYCPFFCQLIRETLNEAISFELEQIKEELEGIHYTVCGIPSERKEPCEIKDEAIQIVSKHISELKGE